MNQARYPELKHSEFRGLNEFNPGVNVASQQSIRSKSRFNAKFIDRLIRRGRQELSADLESPPTWLVKALTRNQADFQISSNERNALTIWRAIDPNVIINLVRGARESPDVDTIALLQILRRHVLSVHSHVATKVQLFIDNTITESDREGLKEDVSFVFYEAILRTLNLVIPHLPTEEELSSMQLFDLTMFMDANKVIDIPGSVAKSKARIAVPLLYHLNGEITRRYLPADWKKIISKLTGYAHETVRSYCKDDLNEDALLDVKRALEVLMGQVDKRLSTIQRKSL